MAQENNNTFLFGKENYILLIAGAVTVVIGLALMSGGGSEDPNVFNPEIFSFRRITLAPIVMIIGFAVAMVGVFKRPKTEN